MSHIACVFSPVVPCMPCVCDSLNWLTLLQMRIALIITLCFVLLRRSSWFELFLALNCRDWSGWVFARHWVIEIYSVFFASFNFYCVFVYTRSSCHIILFLCSWFFFSAIIFMSVCTSGVELDYIFLIHMRLGWLICTPTQLVSIHLVDGGVYFSDGETMLMQRHRVRGKTNPNCSQTAAVDTAPNQNAAKCIERDT